MVFDWLDPQNYVIIRYSTHEHGWHLFTVVDGERVKQENATTSTQTDPGFNAWMSLSVEKEGGQIVAKDGPVTVINCRHTADVRVGDACRASTSSRTT